MVIEEATLARDYAAAAANFDKSTALQRFSEITAADKNACDAWVGRISCGDDSQITLFRAWMSRRNLNCLASAAGGDLSVAKLNAKVDVGGPLVDMTVSIRNATHLSVAYAIGLAGSGNYDDALEALEDIPAEDLWNAWGRVVIYACGQRWDRVQDLINEYPYWNDQREPGFRACSQLMRGVACAHLGLAEEALRNLQAAASDSYVPGQVAVARTAAWYGAMALRALGRPEEAATNLSWLQSHYPDPKVEEAIKNPSKRIEVTSRSQIQARTDPWDAASVQAVDSSGRDKLLNEAQALLEKQIGLVSVKAAVEALWAGVEMDVLRRESGKKTNSKTLHLAFTGPPGTGKTTIARVVANIYAGLGLIPTPKLVEVKRKDLVGTHLGQTAPKTDAKIDEAMDGVLFIDEAYTLIQTGLAGGDAFGQEAVDTLLARMENDRDRLIVIIAGYDKEIDRFLAANDGLRSRFKKKISFPSYSLDELVLIAELISQGRDSVLSDGALHELRLAAQGLAATQVEGRSGLDQAGNARYMRNVVEAAEEVRDLRLNIRRRRGEQISDPELELVESSDMVQAIEDVHSLLSKQDDESDGSIVELLEAALRDGELRQLASSDSDPVLEGMVAGLRHAFAIAQQWQAGRLR
ncbi:type VII secretion AAA-ATPase EccA [Mycobacteroides salmoniphilum]|uniref:ESX-1 secretion system protein EccA1 n=1 Tax=Mycobacteroides salmoniphilum TaxID=404941 RepID=A0A4R8SZU8_9MYCO|nr:type VII secretion AAA-ATPase EccA [Mycobacteroides salmoniphilum]TEA09123.1 ESX-1 secretion system protein EccA1 [Mycobacteroides salmoniphilum]